MSHPQPPQRPPILTDAERYAKAVHNFAVITLVACPILIMLPPQRLNFFTFSLGGATLYSANYLIQEQTGRDIWQHLSRQQTVHLPPLEQNPPTTATEHANLPGGYQHAIQELQRVQRNEKYRPVTEEIKSQREAWKVQREREIKEDVGEGKGFGDMIIDQIWEVWNWGKTEDDEDD